MGSVNGSEGEDLGVIDFSSIDFGALVDEDKTAETATEQGYVTDETSADSFADLFSEENSDTEIDTEPVPNLETNEPEPEFEPVISDTAPDSNEVDETAGSSEGVTEQYPVFETDSIESESLAENSDPVDSRGRGTYDPFA